MKQEIESVLIPIEFSDSLSVALFPWQGSHKDDFREECVQHLCKQPKLELGKRETGQPFLKNSDLGISFSHTKSILAVSVASKHPPGVDVEYLREQIVHIAPRVFSAEELQSVATFPVLPALHILWGTKEAVYKSYGKRGLNFKSDIEILPFHFDEEGGNLQARLRGANIFSIRYKFLPGNLIIVYTTDMQE